MLKTRMMIEHQDVHNKDDQDDSEVANAMVHYVEANNDEKETEMYVDDDEDHENNVDNSDIIHSSWKDKYQTLMIFPFELNIWTYIKLIHQRILFPMGIQYHLFGEPPLDTYTHPPW